MSTLREVRASLHKQNEALRDLERQRRETSNQVRAALHAGATETRTVKAPRSKTLLHTGPRRSVAKQSILVASLTLLVVGALAVIIAVTTPAVAYVFLSDTICAAQNRLGLDSDYTRLTERFALLDSTPLPTVFSAEHNRSLFWGTYRPHLLAGVKSREQRPLLFGIGWYDVADKFGVRHTAEESNDLLFRWDVHDGRTFGKEVIVDSANKLELSVRFLKSPDGDGWFLRVDGTRRGSDRPIEFFVYFATETGTPSDDPHAPTLLQLNSEGLSRDGAPQVGLPAGAYSMAATVVVSGPLQTGGHFRATVHDAASSRWMETCWEAFTWPKMREQWKMNFRNGGSRLQEHLQNRRPTKPNGAILLKKRLTKSFRFDVELTEQPSTDTRSAFGSSCTAQSIFVDREAHFHHRFETTFGVRSKAEQLQRRAAQRGAFPEPSLLVKMAESALSNMIGGMGYWYGDYLIKTKKGYVTAGPASLFSGVPSRAKFPRGFLWDEGFHQLLIAKWDAGISKDVILHWIDGDVVNRSSGWIPREQILGAEPRTRVPPEFVPQVRSHTNPPSMILQVENFALRRDDAADAEDPFLRRALPAVQRWLTFLFTSQCGGSQNCTVGGSSRPDGTLPRFRWRSRNKYHLLASGLDDYPRTYCEPDWKELHVDLFCWAGMMSKTVRRIREALGLNAVADSEVDWARALDEIHYDPVRRRYSDVTGCATDKSDPAYFSSFFGYVNLFPLLTMVLDDPDRARDLLRDTRAELQGSYGLQSLSNRSRAMLTQHDDYWTGPIWINLNYMMLRALHIKYIPMLGEEAASLYDTLRFDLVRNIGQEFARTGKLWEHYNFRNGMGSGTAPFTGWTALIIAILSEDY